MKKCPKCFGKGLHKETIWNGQKHVRCYICGFISFGEEYPDSVIKQIETTTKNKEGIWARNYITHYNSGCKTNDIIEK